MTRGSACAPYHETIGAVARRHPDRTAIEWPGGMISYQQLRHRAEAVANELGRLGVRHGEFVGLWSAPGPGLVTGMLGVSLAGAAFVPWPVSEPADRLRTMIADSGVAAVVGAADPAMLPFSGKRLELGPDGTPLDRPPKVNGGDGHMPRTVRVTGADAAYMLYTSGSTGVPKGVLIAHSSLASYLDFCVKTWVDPAAPMPVVTSPGFDAVMKQVLAPLLAGVTTWFPEEEVGRDPRALARLAADPSRPSTTNCVPSVWRAALAEWPLSPGAPTGVRRLLLGGEVLDDDLLRRTREVLPGLEIWNLYGPTEATANASAGRVEDAPAPLGSPLPGVSLYVLDDAGAPVAVGEVGELHVSGPGVARGYYGRPADTAERFVPDPFAVGARMFRTGDLVRLVAPDRLEFHGRADRMVKRQGVRIELGEIECALRALPNIYDAAVVTVPDADGCRLVAFVAAGDRSASIDPPQVRRYLTDLLPRAAIPDAIKVVAALPRTDGGKPDLASLRDAASVAATGPGDPTVRFTGGAAMDGDPDAAAGGGPGSPEEPEDLDAAIAVIWAEVLGVDRVPADADFFELGGHSLAMIRIVGRVADLVGAELPVDVFFDTPTLSEFVAAVRKVLASEVVQR